jgi:hypothetical protein
MVSFSSKISLLIFCLDDLCIGERDVLKSPTTTVLESICMYCDDHVVFVFASVNVLYYI